MHGTIINLKENSTKVEESRTITVKSNYYYKYYYAKHLHILHFFVRFFTLHKLY